MSKAPFLDGLSSETFFLKSTIVPCWGWRLIWVTESTLSSLVLTSKIYSSPFSLKCRTHNSFSLFLGLLFHVSLLIIVWETGPCTQQSLTWYYCHLAGPLTTGFLLGCFPWQCHTLVFPWPIPEGPSVTNRSLGGIGPYFSTLWSICVPSIDTFDLVGSK